MRGGNIPHPARAAERMTTVKECTEARDVWALVPKDKFDISGIEGLLRLTEDEIAPALPALLEWLRDGNWPAAKALRPVLTRHQRRAAPVIARLLRPEQRDEDWKWFLLCDLLPHFSGEALCGLLPAVRRIAAEPTQGERDGSVDVAALDFLASLPRGPEEGTAKIAILKDE